MPQLFENALNTEASKKPTELEVMLYMNKRMKVYLDQGMKPNWKEIETNACASLPPCASYIGALSKVIQELSGGPEGELLQDLLEFSKAFKCSSSDASRSLGGEFLMTLAGLSFGVEKFPLVKHAMLKLNLQSEPDLENLCRFVTTTHISRLNSKDKRHLVKACDKVCIVVIIVIIIIIIIITIIIIIISIIIIIIIAIVIIIIIVIIILAIDTKISFTIIIVIIVTIISIFIIIYRYI